MAALVSPLTPPTSSYDLSNNPFGASSSDPSTAAAHIRALPTPPSLGAIRRPGSSASNPASPTGSYASSSSPGGASSSSSTARRGPLPTSPSLSSPSTSPSSPDPVRSPSAPPFLERASGRTASASPSPTSSHKPQQSSQTATTASTQTVTPQSQTLQHANSASTNSLPRMPQAAHYNGHQNHLSLSTSSIPSPSAPSPATAAQMTSTPTTTSAYPLPTFPSFPHHYPNPQYPFIPSPHPSVHQQQAAGYGPGPFSPGFVPGGGIGRPASPAEQQRLLHQAQMQQQQWHMEMMRTQQQHLQQQKGLPGGGFDWGGQQQQQQGSSRRRATSGPAPASSASQIPPFFPSNLPYPASPSLFGGPGAGMMMPSAPSTAALGHGHGHGGYPTPPASVEGSSPREPPHSSSRGGAGGAGEGYHPYRRGTAPPGSSGAGTGAKIHADELSLAQQQHHHQQAANSKIRALPNHPHGSHHQSSHSYHGHQSRPSHSPSPSHGQGRLESTQNFPSSSSSTTKVSAVAPSPPVQSPTLTATASLYGLPPPGQPQHHHSRTSSTASSVRSVGSSPHAGPVVATPSAPFANGVRARTDSNQTASSSGSSSIRPSAPRERERTDSNSSSTRGPSIDLARCPTPTAANSSSQALKPSPLSRHAPPPTIDDGDESDDTTNATVSAPVAVVQGDKGKDKNGMKSKFKRAFSISSTTATGSGLAPGLTEADLEGRGPTRVVRRAQLDSESSEESEASPKTPPTQSSSSSSRPPSAASNGRRFGLLNSKLNSSTDNISISSTVSSASIMIRKLGQMGKLARRNSLMGLTKAFKSNKDKDKDEDGVLAVDPSNPASKLSKKDKKKGAVASANVSHVTAEVESSSSMTGMSPAAALAKKHQLQYAQQEAAAAAAAAAQMGPPRSFTVHARTESAASEASSIKSGKSWGRSKTTDDVVEGSSSSRKEKDRLKSRNKSRKWGVFGGSSGNHDRDDVASQADSDDTATPRQSFEVLAPEPRLAPAYSSYGGSYFEDDTITLETPTQPFVDDEYEPSLAGHSNTGHRRDARAVKGILKGAGTYNQEDYLGPRPIARARANSFDSPHQQGRPGSPRNAALVGIIPSEAQVDGFAPSATSSRSDTIPPTLAEAPATVISSSPYHNPSLNASAPVLNHTFGNNNLPLRSASSPGSGRRITFAQNLSVHTTWPATVYDRRAEPSTSNRLTPSLAQQIKEELNAFKMEEMEVHHASRQLTHFFV